MGFAPRQAPEIVVVALFENGAEGPLAAPIVRDVLKAYFDKKARVAHDIETPRRGDAETRAAAFERFGLPDMFAAVAPSPREAPSVEAAFIGSGE